MQSMNGSRAADTRPARTRRALACAVAAAVSLAACAEPDSAGGGGSGGGGTGGGTGGGGGGFRAIELMDRDERVTGVHCVSADACVVSTDTPGEEGHVYATDGHAITGTLVTGDDELAAELGTLGTLTFLGFSEVGSRLVARVEGQEAAFVSATGDPTDASSWTAVRLGTASGAEFGLNAQYALQSSAGRHVLVGAGRIFESEDTLGDEGAVWTNIWSPQASSPIPSDIDELREADPTICNTDPTVSISPPLLQPTYVHPDLSLVVAPSGSVNQDGDDTPGVCISVDGGALFHHVELADVEQGSGPVGVTCTSSDHCVAYGGLRFREDSAYVFVTENASEGADSTWIRADVPVFVEDTELRGAAFAPDGVHGWIVGSAGPAAPLLLETTDGGLTWTDETDRIRALAPDVRLHTVYAFDGTHVWIGGEHDVLLTTGG